MVSENGLEVFSFLAGSCLRR